MSSLIDFSEVEVIKIEKTAFLQWLLQCEGCKDNPKKLEGLIRHLIATSNAGEYEQLWDISTITDSWGKDKIDGERNQFLDAANLIIDLYKND